MGSIPAVPQQARDEAVEGGMKQKNVGGQGKNRKALNDIGNIVSNKDVEVKPQCPITRRSSAQLLANEAANNKAPDGGAPNATGRHERGEKAAALVATKADEKQVATRPKIEEVEVIEVSPDTEKVLKLSWKSTKKKGVPTMTALLTARSKTARGLSKKPKEPVVVDIDASDAENELAVVEYVEDIYNFYKLAEDESRAQDYMGRQPYINKKMRGVLIDWLIEVHDRFELEPETLYLTVSIVDRFLSLKEVPQQVLQLVGIAALLIACKYEEIWAPEVNDFVSISNGVYKNNHILQMEKLILSKLEWNLTLPTHYVFLVRFIKASIPDQQVENLVYFLAELALVHYDSTIMYSPSMVAASAVYVARLTFNKSPAWTHTLELHTGFSEQQLIDCAKSLANLHSMASKNEQKVVYRKYLKTERGGAALHPPSKSLLTPSS